ncbi:aspartate/glutamate racemase family protein [Mesorhizobium sp. BR1-1-16]|uniref:aspartate/glutamate racemase family protein n=1 Tax=Mesorhizobium sp. BR1-1-16 TaxID=2876653 RepID=UPI001CCF8A49|nr:aspartate/glutamate racemase family protein [Mesorhizobium sp. BR1-1-16]MBZ9936102.1 aspartate/glutamate racemase family protein [Mesorhizobium sp. BR1-1-16]
MKIACLHTHESNAAGFDAAAAELCLPPGLLVHAVQPELLAEAERKGGLTADVVSRTVEALLALTEGADAVLLTCSTLGPAADDAASRASVPILRADAALAMEAVAGGGRVVALCAVATTIAPTTKLFTEAAAQTGAIVEIRMVDGAWDLFRAGRREDYLAAIAAAADAACREGASIVAFAQASMAGAAALVTAGPRPPSSPLAGLRRAVAAAQSSVLR